ncbi:MAG TPA: thioredoxin [Burkholderiaceae bacterium]|nr:thioredoxin [Burkholderiaceae bacterium]
MNVTAQSFQTDVLEASRTLPVLVDFWAPWCGPCRALGPMLERLEEDRAGGFRLVKINTDENPELSAQYGVRSIPYVVAFVDGQPVDSFVGVLPEPQLRAFVDRIAPEASEIERRKAGVMIRAGDRTGALAALRAALALKPANDDARLDLAALLLDTGAVPERAACDEAQDVLRGAGALAQQSPRFRALQTRLDSLAQSERLPSADELQRRIAAQPSDLQARADFARLLIAGGQFEPALEHLLEIVGRDRNFGDDYARKAILAVFDLMADQPQIVSAYRRRLASALNR